MDATTQPSPAESLANQKRERGTVRRCADKRTDRIYPLTCSMRARRNKLGLTLRDVGEAVGMSAAGLSVIEHGAETQMTTAIKLARFFGCKVEEIWGEKTTSQGGHCDGDGR